MKKQPPIGPNTDTVTHNHCLPQKADIVLRLLRHNIGTGNVFSPCLGCTNPPLFVNATLLLSIGPGGSVKR